MSPETIYYMYECVFVCLPHRVVQGDIVNMKPSCVCACVYVYMCVLGFRF